MTAEQEQIKLSYERLQMTPEEISSDRKLDVETIKVTLMAMSPKYRKDCGHEDEGEDKLNFSDQQLERVNQRLFDIAVSCENESVALKACMYVRDDKKGRKDVINSIRGLNFNVLNFNQMLQMADSAVQRSLGGPTLNVPKEIQNA